MIRAPTFVLAVLMTLPQATLAAPTLAMPKNARQTAEASDAMTTVALPTGPWTAGGIATEDAVGAVTTTAWRISGGNATSLQLLTPLRDQLRAEGFDVLFECETESCGGFDFRYQISVLPEPQMHVDLGDFRFLTARRTGAKGMEHICLLVSRSSQNGFVQLIRVGPANTLPLATAVSSKSSNAALPLAQTGDFAALLDASGTVPLDDLVFETGSSDLGADSFPSLAVVASYLRAHPDRRVTLVGHTDAEGSLAGNIALSKRRAQSVVRRLVDKFGVDSARITAEGVGFLAPRASNLTTDGRTKNRRVEVMLTSTQ
jgi:OOP family OmpA-OmpF porin